MPPREAATATPSRRRTSSSVLPSPTDRCFLSSGCMWRRRENGRKWEVDAAEIVWLDRRVGKWQGAIFRAVAAGIFISLLMS